MGTDWQWREWHGWDGHSVYPDDSMDTPVNWHTPQIKKRPTRLTKLLILTAVSALAIAIILLVAAAWVITIGWLKLVVLIVLVQL